MEVAADLGRGLLILAVGVLAGRGRLSVVLADLLAASDRAASAYSAAPSVMAAFTSALASVRSCRSGISRISASSNTSPEPKLVSVLKPGKGWCRFSCPGLASLASIGVWHRSSQPRIPSMAAAGPTRPTVMSRGADGESASAGPYTATP